MDIELYREKRQKFQDEQPVFRDLCLTCLQPSFGCYCQQIRKFDPLVKFVILIHPIEARRRIATGRMSHLCLENSELIRGQDFSEDIKVNQILSQPKNHCVILYPGKHSFDLGSIGKETERNIFPVDKKLVIFVIDGTWATAKKTLYQSRNLQTLNRICFSPSRPSNFRVRKQPAVGCYSTVEAIHQTLDMIGMHIGFPTELRKHDALISVFDYMVEKQLSFMHRSERRFLRRKV